MQFGDRLGNYSAIRGHPRCEAVCHRHSADCRYFGGYGLASAVLLPQSVEEAA
jgi:hypothetical protein